MTTIREITVPDIGQFSGVEVIEVAIEPGMRINAEDSLITLETEKASMDVPSPFEGVVQEVKLKVGDKVSEGDIIALLQAEEDEAIKAPKPEQTDSPTTATTAITVSVPDTGGAKKVEVIEVAVNPGDVVDLDDTLITLESEKASMDIPAESAGIIDKVLVKVGDKVGMGDPIVEMTIKQAPSSAPTQPSVPVSQSTPSTRPSAIQPPPHSAPQRARLTAPQTDTGSVYAGPATRRLALELGVDLTKVSGTGRKGRVITADVHAYVKNILQNQGTGGLSIEKAPDIDFAAFGEIEVNPLSRIKKWTAKNLHRNWVMIPHVTQFDEADITDLEAFRKANKDKVAAEGVKLTPLAFIIKAAVAALGEFPQFNASLAANGSDLVFKKYCHIGIAVDTPSGLMVPVLRDADKKDLLTIAREVIELSQLAKDGKLKAKEMQGSSFTLSSLGSIGGTAFTPIINAPDVAILGISKAQIKPKFVDNTFVPRNYLPVSLSYDHRVIDGVEAAKFASFLVKYLENIENFSHEL